jgi:metal-responsive CopG/Arc/MetJ family transcriptional regulator
MAKVNVSLPDELLDAVDVLTQELHRSRSGFVAEATAHYITHVRDEIAHEERRRSIEAAMLGAREIAQHTPPGMDTTEIIRKDRDSDYKPRMLDE